MSADTTSSTVATAWNGRLQRLTELLESHPLGVALLVNSVVFATTYASYTAIFLTNDDASMMLRAAGVSKVAAPSEMILFTHVAIGWVLKTLYTFAAQIPWYGAYLVANLFVAHTAILYAVLWRKPDLRILGFFLLYFLVFGMQILQQLQFTIVASYLSLAGFSLLVVEAGLRDEGQQRRRLGWQLVLGIALVVFGCMIRWRAMVLVTALFMPYFGMLLLRPTLRASLSRIWPIALAIVLSGVARETHEAVYSADPGWRSYREFNPRRAEFVDYSALRRLPREQRLALLNSVGWSGNDYLMMERWFFMDEDLYSLERFEALIDRLPLQNTVESAENLERLADRLTSPLTVRALMLSLFFVVASRWSLTRGLALTGSALAVAAVVGILILYYKPPPPRVLLPILGYLTLAPLLLYEAPTRRSSLRAMATLACFAWLAVQVPAARAHNSAVSEQAEANSAFLHEQLALLNPQPTTLYVTWHCRFPTEFVLPFEDVTYLKSMHMLGLGTAQRSPAAAEQLASHQIEDLYLASATRDDVLFLTEKPSLFEHYTKYIKQHYRLRVSPRLEWRAGPIHLYSIQNHGTIGGDSGQPALH